MRAIKSCYSSYYKLSSADLSISQSARFHYFITVGDIFQGQDDTVSVRQRMTHEPRHEISNNLTSVDSDGPLQPPVKLRNSKWCSVSSLTINEYSND